MISAVASRAVSLRQRAHEHQNNHKTHKVSLGPRVVRKLKNDKFYELSFIDLEAAVGRLLYSSAVLGIIQCNPTLSFCDQDRTKTYQFAEPVSLDREETC